MTDFEADLDHRPVTDIIADISHDLGLGGVVGNPSRWKRRTPDDVAALAARAARTLLERAALPGIDGPDQRPANTPERHFRQFAVPSTA